MEVLGLSANQGHLLFGALTTVCTIIYGNQFTDLGSKVYHDSTYYLGACMAMGLSLIAVDGSYVSVLNMALWAVYFITWGFLLGPRTFRSNGSIKALGYTGIFIIFMVCFATVDNALYNNYYWVLITMLVVLILTFNTKVCSTSSDRIKGTLCDARKILIAFIVLILVRDEPYFLGSLQKPINRVIYFAVYILLVSSDGILSHDLVRFKMAFVYANLVVYNFLFYVYGRAFLGGSGDPILGSMVLFFDIANIYLNVRDVFNGLQ